MRGGFELWCGAGVQGLVGREVGCRGSTKVSTRYERAELLRSATEC